MSWFSDGLDAVSGIFAGAGDGGQTSSSGSGWSLDKVLGLVDKGRKAYNLFDMNDARQDSRSQLLDQYAKMDAANNAYAQQMAAYQQQQAAGAAAARRANDAAARKAQANALKVQQKYLKQMAANYQPYADAAKTLTPAMAKNYQQYLDTTSLLNQYLAPSVMKGLGSAPAPAAMPQLNQAAYTAPATSTSQVSFPSLEEILGRK